MGWACWRAGVAYGLGQVWWTFANRQPASRIPMPHLRYLVALSLLIVGCSTPREQRAPFAPLDPVAPTADTRAAEQAMADFDRQLDGLRGLPPAAALAKQQAMGPAITATVERTAGSRFENKAVYFLAQWCFNFNDDGAGVDAALDRLDGLDQPQFKRSGRALRVQHLLRQERRTLARTKAEALVEELPEFGFLLTMCTWHERLGGIVEQTGGRDLAGQPSDPATSQDRWVLYLHLDEWNDQAAFTVRRYCEAIGQRDIRLVPVVRDGSARRIAADLEQIPGAAQRVTLLYCRSGDEAKQILKDWQLPLNGWTVLLDRDRRISRVEVRPGDLAEIQ